VASAARAAGITSPMTNPDARLALGNKEVSPVELASAYATIAAGGVWHAPHLVSRVVTSDGRVLYQAPDSGGERRFPEQVARNVVEAMSGVAPADGLTIGRPVAGKTGTVQSRFEGQNNDAWFSGFTPDLATTVWVGTDMNSPIRTASGTPIDGKSLPGEMWQTFMKEAVADRPQQSFGGYTPIGERASDLAPNETPTPTPTPEPTPSTELPPPVDPNAPAPEAAEPVVPPAGSPVPGGNPAAPQQQSDPAERGLLAPEGRTAPDPQQPPQDCSVTPCG
jgi:membrane peptidoglycan carboxypeptidase